MSERAGTGGVAMVLCALFLLGATLGALGPPTPEAPGRSPEVRFRPRGAPVPPRPLEPTPGGPLLARLPATLAGLLVLGALVAYPWRSRERREPVEREPFAGPGGGGGLGGAVYLPKGRPPAW